MSGVLVLEFLAVGDDSEVALLVPRVTVDRPDHLLAAAYDRVKVGDAVMRSAVHGGETLPHGFRGHRHTSVDQVLRADLNVAHGSTALAVLVDGTAAAVKAQTTTPAHTVTESSQTHFHPFTVVSPDFREDTFLPVSAEFGGPESADSGCSGQNLAPTLHWYNVPRRD